MRLCFGTYATVLSAFRATGSASKRRLVETLLSTVFRCTLENPVSSRYLHGKQAFSIDIIDAANTVRNGGDFAGLTLKFRNNVAVSNLIKVDNEKNRALITEALIDIIERDAEISDDSVVDIVNGATKKDLLKRAGDLDFPSFLAGIFLYAVTSIGNKLDDPTVVKTLNNDYFEGIAVRLQNSNKSEHSPANYEIPAAEAVEPTSADCLKLHGGLTLGNVNKMIHIVSTAFSEGITTAGWEMFNTEEFQISAESAKVQNMSEFQVPDESICAIAEGNSGNYGKFMIFKNRNDARIILNRTRNQESEITEDFDWNECNTSELSKLFNQLIGVFSEKLSKDLGYTVGFDKPVIHFCDSEDTVPKISELAPECVGLEVIFKLKMDDVIDSKLTFVVERDWFRYIIRAICVPYNE
jgi:hypothetical protein